MTSTDLKTSDISIIIPTLNEEANIPSLAANLKGCGCEGIIVDGGSHDNTLSIAAEHGFRVLSCSPGRAAQLNHGAAAAQGRILLFLHADTRLPDTFATAIVKMLKGDTFIAGAFSLAMDQPTAFLDFIAACANLRSRLLQLPYGDQAIFLRKETFQQLGGFPDLPIMEDYIFMKNAGKHGQIGLLTERVTTSARRWKRLGVLRTTITNQIVVIGFFLGVSPKRLASLYRR